MGKRPLVIGHMGNAGEAPENTAAGFRQALDLGVDLVELDANRTLDRAPVVWHGPGLDHAGRPEVSIHDLTLDACRGLDIGAWKGRAFQGQRILTLEEALCLLGRDAHVAVDLKTFDIIPSIVTCIEKAGMADRVQVCGCDVAAARAVRACNAELSVGLNTDGDLEALARKDHAAFCRAYVAAAARDHLAPLNVSHRHVTPELVRMARLRAIPVWAWTVDEPDDVRRMLDLGVDAIYTNHPRRLLGMLNDREAG